MNENKNESTNENIGKIAAQKKCFNDAVLSYIKLEDFPFGKTEIRVEPEIILKRNKLKNICIIQLSALGDVILSTPVINNLKKENPDVKISFITYDNYVNIIKSHHLIDNIYTISLKKLFHLYNENPQNSYDYIESVLSKMECKNFDLVLNYHPSKFASYLISVLKSKYKIGLQYNEQFSDTIIKGDFYMYFKYFRFYILEKSIFFENNVVDLFLKSAQFHNFDRSIVLSKSNKELSLKKEEGVIYIGIVFGASSENKYYPPENYAKFIRNLCNNTDTKTKTKTNTDTNTNSNTDTKFKFILFGSKDEINLSKIICKNINIADEDTINSSSSDKDIKNDLIINLSGKTDLDEIIDYMDLCDYVITNDTGPMHIAASLNKKLIVLLGPIATKPIVKDAIILSAKNVECKYCMENTCENNKKCFDAVTPEILSDIMISVIENKNFKLYENVLIETTSNYMRSKCFSTEYLSEKEVDINKCKSEIVNFFFLKVWESMNLSLYYENDFNNFEDMILNTKIQHTYYAVDDICSIVKRKFSDATVQKSIEDVLKYIDTNYNIVKKAFINAVIISEMVYKAFRDNDAEVLSNLNEYLKKLDEIDALVNQDIFLKKFFNLTNVMFYKQLDPKVDYIEISYNDFVRYKIKLLQLEYLKLLTKET